MELCLNIYIYTLDWFMHKTYNSGALPGKLYHDLLV